MNRNHTLPILQALTAALLFGISAPLSKLFLGEIAPISLAALLYLGSGLGLLAVRFLRRANRQASADEAGIKRSDAGWLAGAIFTGGVAAPILLMLSLQRTPAATASLLLNFESSATALVAALIFREAVSRRVWLAAGLITLASIALSVEINAVWGFSLGALGILVACLMWGFDNNFTRCISAKDPLAIVTIKGLAAGSFSLLMAGLLAEPLPALPLVLGAMLVGFFCYGISIVLYIRALRDLGAARTSTLFGIAPLAGMLLSFMIFREFPGILFWIALPLMAVGTFLLVKEHHTHTHSHAPAVHEHTHNHDDDHHAHDHASQPALTHSHIHGHSAVQHGHKHMPDLHHRHEHPTELKK